MLNIRCSIYQSFLPCFLAIKGTEIMTSLHVLCRATVGNSNLICSLHVNCYR